MGCMRIYRDRYSGKSGLLKARELAYTSSLLDKDDNLIILEDGIYKFIPWNAEIKGEIIEYTIYKGFD